MQCGHLNSNIQFQYTNKRVPYVRVRETLCGRGIVFKPVNIFIILNVFITFIESDKVITIHLLLHT